MFALIACILFIVAAIKQDDTSSPVFWALLALSAWALHFFLDPWLSPYYGRRRGTHVP